MHTDLRCAPRCVCGPGSPPALGDPITRFRLRVGLPWQRAIPGLLVGQKTIPEVHWALQDQGHAVEETAVRAFCKSLRYLRLTRDTDLEVLERIPLVETFPSLQDRPPIQQVEVERETESPAGAAATHFFLNTRDDGACLGVADRRPLSLYATPRNDRAAGLTRMAAALDRVVQIGRTAEAAAVTAPRGGADIACRLGEATRAAELGAALCREEAACPRDGDAAVLATVVGTFLDRGAVDGRLRRLLRDLLFARRLGLSPTPALGVAYLALLVSLILAGARWQAAANGRRTPTDEDVDRAQFTAIQLLRFPKVPEFLFATDELAAVYDQLAVL